MSDRPRVPALIRMYADETETLYGVVHDHLHAPTLPRALARVVMRWRRYRSMVTSVPLTPEQTAWVRDIDRVAFDALREFSRRLDTHPADPHSTAANAPHLREALDTMAAPLALTDTDTRQARGLMGLRSVAQADAPGHDDGVQREFGARSVTDDSALIA